MSLEADDGPKNSSIASPVIEVLSSFIRVTCSSRQGCSLAIQFTGRYQSIGVCIRKTSDVCVHFGAIDVGEYGVDAFCYVHGDVQTDDAGSADQDRHCD